MNLHNYSLPLLMIGFCCSVAGALVLVSGFYAVIWGRAKDSKMKRDAEADTVGFTGHEVPLLQENRIQEA